MSETSPAYLLRSLRGLVRMPAAELSSERRMFKPCVVIPVFNHEGAVSAVVTGVVAQNLPCIVVDDGSSAGCSTALDELAVAFSGVVTLLRHTINRGKGDAVLTGLRYAARAGYSH